MACINGHALAQCLSHLKDVSKAESENINISEKYVVWYILPAVAKKKNPELAADISAVGP